MIYKETQTSQDTLDLDWLHSFISLVSLFFVACVATGPRTRLNHLYSPKVATEHTQTGLLLILSAKFELLCTV